MFGGGILYIEVIFGSQVIWVLIVNELGQPRQTTKLCVLILAVVRTGEDIIKEMVKDGYTGDVSHEEGLAKSIEPNIEYVFWKNIEGCAILTDFQIDSMGGTKTGLYIFEPFFLPFFLIIQMYGWGKHILTNKIFKYLFDVPDGTPQGALWGKPRVFYRQAQKARVQALSTFPFHSIPW